MIRKNLFWSDIPNSKVLVKLQHYHPHLKQIIELPAVYIFQLLIDINLKMTVGRTFYIKLKVTVTDWQNSFFWHIKTIYQNIFECGSWFMNIDKTNCNNNKVTKKNILETSVRY